MVFFVKQASTGKSTSIDPCRHTDLNAKMNGGRGATLPEFPFREENKIIVDNRECNWKIR